MLWMSSLTSWLKKVTRWPRESANRSERWWRTSYVHHLIIPKQHPWQNNRFQGQLTAEGIRAFIIRLGGVDVWWRSDQINIFFKKYLFFQGGGGLDPVIYSYPPHIFLMSKEANSIWINWWSDYLFRLSPSCVVTVLEAPGMKEWR